jgi:hypothetical protein
VSDVYVVEFSYGYEGNEAVFGSARLEECFAFLDQESQRPRGDEQIVTRFAPLPVEIWTRYSTGRDLALSPWMHQLLVDGKWTVQR